MLVAAFLVSKSCGATQTSVDQDRAISIAQASVDFTPDRSQVRYLKRGLQPHGYWAVSLVVVNDAGAVTRSAVVLVDAESGKVAEIRQ
ncbi:MAG TPA: hypothetical protein VH306_08995 [Gaiellaceae bacterium]